LIIGCSALAVLKLFWQSTFLGTDKSRRRNCFYPNKARAQGTGSAGAVHHRLVATAYSGRSCASAGRPRARPVLAQTRSCKCPRPVVEYLPYDQDRPALIRTNPLFE
jgi:hypothetical protein